MCVLLASCGSTKRKDANKREKAPLQLAERGHPKNQLLRHHWITVLRQKGDLSLPASSRKQQANALIGNSLSQFFMENACKNAVIGTSPFRLALP
jgi:hypothetical protein